MQDRSRLSGEITGITLSRVLGIPSPPISLALHEVRCRFNLNRIEEGIHTTGYRVMGENARKYIAELLGTFTLVFIGTSVATLQGFLPYYGDTNRATLGNQIDHQKQA